MTHFQDRNSARSDLAALLPAEITIGAGEYSVPVFANQDDALDVAHQFPAGRALMWNGVDVVTPAYLRAFSGDNEFFVPAFHLKGESGETVVVALMKSDHITTDQILAPLRPQDGRMTIEHFTSGSLESTLLAEK